MKLHGGPDGPEASTWMRAATMTYFMGSSMLVQFTTKVGRRPWRRIGEEVETEGGCSCVCASAWLVL